MYPFLRLITAISSAKRKDKITPTGVSESTFISRPWDMDLFMEMNNGRILTLYDIGRFVLAVRTGLDKVLRNNKWGLVVAGSTVRYRKRVRMFDKVVMRTQIAAYDERWIYITQSMWVNGEAASSVLLRTGVTSKGKVIAAEQVLKSLGLEDWQPTPSPWVKAWIESESLRPWPPNP